MATSALKTAGKSIAAAASARAHVPNFLFIIDSWLIIELLRD
jgi:hypothetical protein